MFVLTKKKFILIFLGIVIFVITSSSYFYYIYQSFLSSHSSNLDNIHFNIKKGSTFKQILPNLVDKKIIADKNFLTLYVRINRLSHKIKAGEYLIKPNISPVALIELFISGKVKQYQITIPEGWTFRQIIQRLHSISSLKPIPNQHAFIKALGIKNNKPEGYFFPDTYFYTKGTSSGEILKRSYVKMQYTLLNQWQDRQNNIPLKTPYEALILASIIEKESGKKGELNKISGVFIRRLNKNIRLQSDPTIIYGMGKRYQGDIRKKDIREKTDYNTYQIDGLPPTPISSPSLAAIQAALHPELGTSLYFVADGLGGHVFSDTLKQHNQAVKRYLQIHKSKIK